MGSGLYSFTTELHQPGRILLSTQSLAAIRHPHTTPMCAQFPIFQAHQVTTAAQAPYYEQLPLPLCAGGVSFGVMDLQHCAVWPKCCLRPIPFLQYQQRVQGRQLPSNITSCATTGVLRSEVPTASASGSEWGQCTVAQLTMSASR
jgi:hypothetical protein